MPASDDHTDVRENVLVTPDETPNDKDEYAQDAGMFEIEVGGGWSGSITGRSGEAGRGRGSAAGRPGIAAAGLRGGSHREGAASFEQGLVTGGVMRNPDRFAEAGGGTPLLSAGSPPLTRLQSMGVDLRPASSRRSDTSRATLPRAERSTSPSRMSGARPERGIRVGAPARPSLHGDSAPTAPGVTDATAAPRDTRALSTRSGAFFLGSSDGIAAIAALGIGVGLDVSVAASAAWGPLGNGAKIGAVTAGVFMVISGVGLSLPISSPTVTLTYERATDSSVAAGLTAQCVPQVVLATPLGSLQVSGQNLDSAVTLSFGLALALGIFSGVSCGVALNAE